MSASTRTYRVRRALTVEEMTLICDNARRATSPRALLGGVVADLYNALLSDEHRSIADLDARDPLDPGEYAIPTSQWEMVLREATGRAAAWGTSADIALELIQVRPDTYDDPEAAVPPADTTDHRPVMLTLRLTREAVDTITAIDRYLAGLATAYGADSRVCRTAADSWGRQLMLLVGMGLGADTTVHRDGGPDSLSLVAQTASGLIVGIIFHRRRRHCTVPGCDATLGDDGTLCGRDGCAPAPDHEHQLSYPVGLPAPGEWLCHS